MSKKKLRSVFTEGEIGAYSDLLALIDSRVKSARTRMRRGGDNPGDFFAHEAYMSLRRAVKARLRVLR